MPKPLPPRNQCTGCFALAPLRLPSKCIRRQPDISLYGRRLLHSPNLGIVFMDIILMCFQSYKPFGFPNYMINLNSLTFLSRDAYWPLFHPMRVLPFGKNLWSCGLGLRLKNQVKLYFNTCVILYFLAKYVNDNPL